MSYNDGIRSPEYTPHLTERMRFVYEGNLVTLHSTGQVYVTDPEGVLVDYCKVKCRFGCMKTD